MRARAITVSLAVTAAITISTPVGADANGIRVGPTQTVCADIPDAAPADVALVNVAVVAASRPAFVTAHSRLTDPFGVASVNVTDSTATPNLTATPVTDDREVCVTVSQSASTHVVMDLVGIIDASAFRAVPGGSRRLLDTRRDGPQIAPTSTRCVPVPGGQSGDVAVVNAAITLPSGPGYVTVHAPDDLRPETTATVNYDTADTTSNMAMVVLDDSANACVTASVSATHVVIDLVGSIDGQWFSRSGTAATRILDTRDADGPTDGERAAPSTPVCVIPEANGGDAVVANVAIAAATAAGFATAHATGEDPQATATNNFLASEKASNATVTVLGDDGRLCVTPSHHGAAHVIIDALGVISGEVISAPANGASRLLDSRKEAELEGYYGASTLAFGQCDRALGTLQSPQLEWLAEIEADPENWTSSGGDNVQPVALPATNGNPSAEVPDFSTTNVQDADVDEGDVVETDGRYIYNGVQEPGEEGTIRVIDVAAGAEVARVDLLGRFPEMILHDGRIFVTTDGGSDDETTATNVTIIDVTDPTSPVIADSYQVEGTRATVRSVDGTAHMVLRSFRSVGYLDPWAYDDIDSLLQAVAAARAEIEAAGIDGWLPTVAPIVDGVVGDPAPAFDCTRLGVPHVQPGQGIMWIAQDDLHGDPGLDAGIGYLSDAWDTTVMANATSLYVASPTWVGWQFGFLPGQQLTQIHQFELNDGTPTTYAASTDVPGRLVNQFAMAEVDGILRVAVTSGWWDDSVNSVFALRRVGRTFEHVSAVTGLAPGESIFSVRHLGTTSYVVTFRQTDPLFVLDFTDPLRPRLDGELKIPGFSTYLHPAPDGLLIGVGQDADEFGRQLGAQASLFDVSDARNPSRIDTADIGGWQTLEDHRAFLYWEPTGTIVVPAAVRDSSETELAVLRLDDRRLATVGRFGCHPVRSIVIGDELISVGVQITIADLDTLQVRATVGACTETYQY